MKSKAIYAAVFMLLCLLIGAAAADGQTHATRQKRPRRVVAGPTAAAKPAPPGSQSDENAAAAVPAPPSLASDQGDGSSTGSAVDPNDRAAQPKTSEATPPVLDLPATREDQPQPVESNPIRAQLKLASELVAANNPAAALAGLRALLETETFDPQGFYNVGNALARLQDADAAIKAYRKAIAQRQGNYSRALNNLGVVLLGAGRWDESYDALIAALKLESFHYAEASYNLGRLYAARGEDDRAAREWRRALAVDPKHPGATRELAGNVRELSGGVATVARSTSPSPSASNRSPSGSAAPANGSRSREKGARLIVDPLAYDLLQRARSLDERGQALDAVANYKRAIARSGGYLSPANFELGCLLLNLKRDDEALLTLQAVINRDAELFPLSYYYVGRLYELRGDLALAEDLFSKAAAAYRLKNPSILLEVSRVREKRQDFGGALAALKEYLQLMEAKGIRPTWGEQALLALSRKAAK